MHLDLNLDWDSDQRDATRAALEKVWKLKNKDCPDQRVKRALMEMILLPDLSILNDSLTLALALADAWADREEPFAVRLADVKALCDSADLAGFALGLLGFRDAGNGIWSNAGQVGGKPPAPIRVEPMILKDWLTDQLDYASRAAARAQKAESDQYRADELAYMKGTKARPKWGEAKAA